MTKLYSRDEAAKFLQWRRSLRVTTRSLATMATRGGGPRFIKQGRYAYYRESDLMDWAELRTSCILDSSSSPRTAAGGPNNIDYKFEHQGDKGDLEEVYDHDHTGNKDFDEITRLLEQKLEMR
jgi:hypothetical protein